MKKDAFDDYFYLGLITKTHGYDGKVVAFIDADNPGAYENMEMVFLNIRGSLVPYFIEERSIKNNRLIIRFQDVNTEADASALVKKELYLPLSVLPKLTGNKFYYHEVKGFTVVDEQFGRVGEIEEILDYPAQAVMQVFHEGKEVLIPVNDDVILQLDREKKTIRIKAPEGLLDLYLNP
ncbi:ribosome maturation factor RimM [Candidatus Sulfidibacterium hydrothermale]|jgi:16S rRNA processing protein RimM|uniref:ribosome maturation factor RimM n=1 Tax=Candidatus Sulfidibacterium hydrothermale TaxID=2875962 RepID=UPI001F0B1DE1|nr:ribosome maturation factor RimM [Candidatus Sulfidibacterium hydrothermale]UBM61096.1 ribosome maturation factor RimM [Candidatus Sulfidibacterium hydrothermale]